jgi:uncharacterized protein YaeQ
VIRVERMGVKVFISIPVADWSVQFAHARSDEMDAELLKRASESSIKRYVESNLPDWARQTIGEKNTEIVSLHHQIRALKGALTKAKRRTC